MPGKAGILATLLLAATLCRAQSSDLGATSHGIAFCGASSTSFTYTDTMQCCFNLFFQYEPADGFYNGIEVDIIPTEPQFSSVQFDLADGWLHSAPEPARYNFVQVSSFWHSIFAMERGLFSKQTYI